MSILKYHPMLPSEIRFFARVCVTFFFVFSVPKETGVYQAAGNTASCSAQGFLDNFLYALSVLMNTILALTYCVIVKRERRDEARSRRSLYLILGLPPIVCFLLACKPLLDKAYNYTGLHVCSIAEHPLGCLSEDHPEYECTRGSNAREIKITRFTCIFLCNVIIIVSVIVLIAHVVSRERRMARRGRGGGDTANAVNTAENGAHGIDRQQQRCQQQQQHRRGRKGVCDVSARVTWQGIWYVAAFFFSWGPWGVWQWIRITNGMVTMSNVESSVLLYIISITHPLQGVANAFVYFRPKYRKFRERDNDELRIASILRTLEYRVPKLLDLDWWQARWRIFWRSNNEDDDDDDDIAESQC
mmetsp:Transcript_39798/g.85809  ORF Transcript_39798/g.85809 Transcript_39798/m.85809 type:complete len:358 (-) Transcript_39798:605-1678(-)